MKKRYAWLTVWFLVALAAAVFQANQVMANSSRPSSIADHPEETLMVNGKPLTLEIVTSAADQSKGLGDRDRMADDHGMLFVFATPSRYTFWMLHMRFPLDILWTRQGKIVDIVYNLPAPATGWQIPATYTPKADADRVVELVAGQADAYGLKIGGTLSTD